jgi:hypothetical protein
MPLTIDRDHAHCPNKDDFTMDLGVFLAKTFNDRPSGLIEAQEDFVISGFFGAGLDWVADIVNDKGTKNVGN